MNLGNCIAKGQFTNVYEHSDPSKVYILTVDPTKDCYQIFDCVLFPKLVYLDTVTSPKSLRKYNEDARVYEGDKLSRCTNQKLITNKEELSIYKQLLAYGHAHSYTRIAKMFESIECSKVYKEELLYGLSCVINFVEPDDLCFEISRRNVMLTSEGRLVLNDILFDAKTMNKRWSSR